MPSKPASLARRAPSANAAMTCSIPAASSRAGSRANIALAITDGATGVTPGMTDWLPAWPSSAKIVPPAAWTCSTSSRKPGTRASSWMPICRGEYWPRAST